jgi:RimJ/RimL family protein N-acetyltransferase
MVSDEIRAKHTGDLEPSHFPIRIKELTERDRRRLLMHFLALNEHERQMRFGSPLPDELVTRYVQKINFYRDVVFGVYDDALQLVGVGHLAYMPRGALPGMANATERERIAEFGVSVLTAYQGQGIGTKLFERAAMHCRNDDIDTLYLHCLTSNDAILHIATKAGMSIHRDHGEADAYLKLPPADPASVLREAFDEQVANLDYTLKANTRALGKFIKSFPRVKGN